MYLLSTISNRTSCDVKVKKVIITNHFKQETSASSLSSYQEGTEHVEADKVDDGKLAAAGLAGRVGLIGGAFLARLAELARQHDLLPGLTCCTSGGMEERCTRVRSKYAYLKLYFEKTF